jgi:hypothetical protein
LIEGWSWSCGIRLSDRFTFVCSFSTAFWFLVLTVVYIGWNTPANQVKVHQKIKKIKKKKKKKKERK